MSDLSFPYGRKRFTLYAALLFWFAAALLALGVSPWWRIASDSALYTVLGRSVATGEGYTFSGIVQTSVPPVTPVCMALVYKVTHAIKPDLSFLGTFLYFNSVTAIFGMAGLVTAFFLVIEIAGPRWGILALVFLVTNRQCFFLAIQPLTDAPYAALSWAALLFFVRAEKRDGWGAYTAAGVLTCLALLTRLVGMALVIAVSVYYAAQYARRPAAKRKSLAALIAALPAACLMMAAVYVIWHFRHAVTFNYWNELVSWQHAGDMVLRMGRDLATIPGGMFEAVAGAESIGGASILLTILIITGAIVCMRKGMQLAVTYFVVYFLFIAAGEEALPRYVAPVLPLALIFMFEGAVAVVEHLARFADTVRPSRALRVVFACFAAGFVLINLGFDGYEIRTSFARDFYRSYRYGKWVDYLNLSNALAGKGVDGRVLLLLPRELTALSNVPTVWMPSQVTPSRNYSPDWKAFATFVKRRGVSAIVTDPEYKASGNYLREFVLFGPIAWEEKGCFGRLTLYTLAGTGSVRRGGK